MNSEQGEGRSPSFATGLEWCLFIHETISSSSVTLGDSLNLVLLLDGVGVSLANTLGGGDDLVGEALAHALVGSEGGFSGTLAHQVDRLVHSSQWADIDGLTSDGTAGSDSC